MLAFKDPKEALAVLIIVPDEDWASISFSEDSSCSTDASGETAAELGRSGGPQQAARNSGQE